MGNKKQKQKDESLQTKGRIQPLSGLRSNWEKLDPVCRNVLAIKSGPAGFQ